MEATEPEPASMTVNDTQQQHQPKPDVVRARKSKNTRQTDNNDGLVRRLYRPPYDEYDPYEFCNMDMPAELMVENKQWTPHELQSRILRVLEAPFLEAKTFHHSASMVGNTITIHSVPLYAFNILRCLLEMDVWAPKWKLEFKNTSISRGRFTVTVPSDMHRAFWSFTRDIEEQMLTSGFLPRRYKGRPTVRQRGRADVKTSRRSLTPDGSISAIGVNARFLILEVAHSKREKEALRKAQIYILDTNERIKVVVVVIVDKKPTPRSRIADARKLCAETDTVHVHVVKYVEGSDWCAAKCVVEKLQIFPGPEPKDTFELAWWDIHGGSWKRARVEMGLPADTPRPMCQINFRELWDTARRLSDYEEPHIGPFSTWDPAKESPKPKKRIIPF